jgi:hypothetical protein
MHRRKLRRHDLRILHIIETDDPDIFGDSIPKLLKRNLQLYSGGVIAANERIRPTAPKMRLERRDVIRLGFEVPETLSRKSSR